MGLKMGRSEPGTGSKTVVFVRPYLRYPVFDWDYPIFIPFFVIRDRSAPVACSLSPRLHAPEAQSGPIAQQPPLHHPSPTRPVPMSRSRGQGDYGEPLNKHVWVLPAGGLLHFFNFLLHCIGYSYWCIVVSCLCWTHAICDLWASDVSCLFVLIFMCGTKVSGYLILGIALWSLYLSYHMQHICSDLSFRLPFVSIYFPNVFTHFHITVYPATVFTPNCLAPTPVSI
jgi:hypothetical protein